MQQNKGKDHLTNRWIEGNTTGESLNIVASNYKKRSLRTIL